MAHLDAPSGFEFPPPAGEQNPVAPSESGPAADPGGKDDKIDTTVPHSARVWNYWLGGKENYAVDREVGDKYREMYPEIIDIARQSRAFLARAVRYLAGEEGIRQFLDIGAGLPAGDNTHEVAQRADPSCRVVYVDNDPLVLKHARALLNSGTAGKCDYIDADVREPEKILAKARETLDFTEPIALMMLGVLGHITDHDTARAIVRRLVDSLPAGSYLVLNDGTNTSQRRVEATRRHNDQGAVVYELRSPEQIASFFEGLELIEPGVVSVSRWRPEPTPSGEPAEVDDYCGVGRRSSSATSRFGATMR
jgi:S-adenosyl methyltransferase